MNLRAINAEIAKIRKYKRQVEKGAATVRTHYGHLNEADRERHVLTYLKGRSLDEWNATYDAHLVRLRRQRSQVIIDVTRNSLTPISAFVKRPYVAIFLILCFVISLGICFSGSTTTDHLTGRAFFSPEDLFPHETIDDVLEIHDADQQPGRIRLIENKGLFGSRVIIENETDGSLTGSLNGKPAMEVILGGSVTHFAYDTELEVDHVVASPHKMTLSYRLFNNKNLDTTYVLVPAGSSVTATDSYGNTHPSVVVAETTDFVADWNSHEPFTSIQEQLAAAGAETRLDHAFPVSMLPGPGMHLELLSLKHDPETWLTLVIEAPTKGLVLFLDPAGSWWDEDWSYRRNITITEQSASALTNFSLQILLNDSTFNFSRANSDGSDIRTLWVNASDELESVSYWIEQWNVSSQYASIWVEVPNVPASGNATVYLYFGNPSASSQSNASSTFLWYDDFNRADVADITAETAYKKTNAGTWAISSNELQNTGATGDPNKLIVDALGILTVPVETTVLVNVSSWAGDADAARMGVTQCVDDVGGTGAGYNMLFHDDQSSLDFLNDGRAWGQRVVYSWNLNTPYYFKMRVLTPASATGDYKIWLANESEPSSWSTGTFGGAVRSLGEVGLAGSNQGDVTHFDDLRIRYAVSAEPSYSVASEEELTILNASLDVPQDASRVYRWNAFTMNGTIWCPKGTCGTVNAWSQFLSTVTPLKYWTETTQEDFNSFNQSVNISVIPAGSLTLEPTNLGGWWDGAWQYRLPINLSEQSGAPLTNYTINLTLDTTALIEEGKLNADCSDLRFADNTSVELDYWLESGCNSSTTIVWVTIPALVANENTTMYLYYGNPIAISASDGSATFLWFDDFNRSDTADITGETAYKKTNTGTWEITSNQLRNTGAAGDPNKLIVDALGDLTVPVESHVRMNVSTWLGTADTGRIGLTQCVDDAGVVGAGYNMLFHNDQTSLDFLNDQRSWGSTLTYAWNTNEWYHLKMRVLDPSSTSGEYKIWADDASEPTSWTSISFGGGAARTLGEVGLTGSERADVTYFDDLRIRRAVLAEPNTNLGTEEQVSFQSSGQYISDSFDTGSSSNTFQKISWDAIKPSNTSLDVFVRSSIDNNTWSSWYQEVNDTSVDAPSRRYVQYKTTLSTTNTTRSASLQSMNIEYKFATLDWKSMDASSGLTASNPYACGDLSPSVNCTPSWSVTPTQQGTYSLRIFANSTDGTPTTMTENHTIDVYLLTYLLDETVFPAIQARGSNMTVTARLIDGQSLPLVSRTVNIYDITDDIDLGNATTNAQGNFSLEFIVPAAASLGEHIFNISYAGNTSEYIESASVTTAATYSSTPNITDQNAYPSLIGIGDPVTLSANVTDLIGVDAVWANVSFPGGDWIVYPLTFVSGDIYSISFTDTWQVGSYTIKIGANNTDGIVMDPEANFTVDAYAEIYAEPEFDEYENFETVYLSNVRREGWWNGSWPYRSRILVEGVNDLLLEYQVPITIDTQSLISAGKLQSNCDDLRFISSQEYYQFPITITNDIGADMTNDPVLITITNTDVLPHLSTDGSGLRIFKTPKDAPYEYASDVSFWLQSADTWSARLWINVDSLADGADQTYYLYYGDAAQATESNYSKVFTEVVGYAGTTAAGSSWNGTTINATNASVPVVVGSLTTANDIAEAALRLANITNTSFESSSEESVTLDGVHAAERIGYVAMLPGAWYIGGEEFDVGLTAIQNAGGNDYVAINFDASFSSTPAVFSQVQTYNDTEPVHMRIQSIGFSSFTTKLEETESGDTPHGFEYVGHIAGPEGLHEAGDGLLQVGSVSATHNPTTFSYASVIGSPALVAKIQTEAGGDNSHERLRDTVPDIAAEEEDAYDGNHAIETIAWLAATPGMIIGASVSQMPSISFGTAELIGQTDLELDYYLSGACNDPATEVLVQVNSIPANQNSTFYYYYGNPYASPASDINATLRYDAPQTIGYVVNNNIASSGLTIYSYENDNTVGTGASSETLQKRGSTSFSVSIGDAVKAMKPVQAESSADGTDIISPSTWAGTEFIYNWRRGTDDFHFVSPWGTANVTIYDNGGFIDNFLVDGTGLFVDNTYDIGNANVMYITSDIPILVQHSQGTGDVTPMYPATSEPLFGIPSGNVRHAAGPNGATIRLNASSGGPYADEILGAYGVSSTANTGADGGTTALRVVSNGTLWPIGSMQQADGDGTESTVFVPERQMGTIFGSSQAVDHIAIAAPTLNTNCTVYNGSGDVVGSSLSAGNSIISRIGFGTGNDNVYVGADWLMYCSAPVMAIFDNDAQDDEQHVMSWADMRQYHYPEPSAAPLAGTEEESTSGLKNTGSTNITGYLYLAVQKNSTGIWQTISPPVFQDIVERKVQSNEVLNLSDIWLNAGGWSTGSQNAGYYRVYAALRDNESNVLIDSDGNPILDTGLFRIKQAIIKLLSITHENDLWDEYETLDSIDWINITIQAQNNTAINAEARLRLMRGGAAASWGPDSTQSCNDLAPDTNCTLAWNNSGNGYTIPASAVSGTYVFNWEVLATADNAEDYFNNSLTIDIHNIPDTFSSILDPSRIFTVGPPTYYNFSFTNLWSQPLLDVNVTINCPPEANLNCSCSGTDNATCSYTSVEADASFQFNFSIDANESSINGDYPINVTLEYRNPREVRNWTQYEVRTLEVRLEGILGITVNESPTTLTRGESGIVRTWIQNTGAQNATNATFNYTIPSGWTNTSPLGVHYDTVEPDEIIWHNLSFDTTLSAALGPREVRIDTQSDQGQEDFKILSVTVFANTSITSLFINDTNASRDENLLFTARLVRDDGVPISGETVYFYDETDDILMGSDTTNASGHADFSYLIPGSASLGVHTFNATYNGNPSIYYHPSGYSNVSEIGLKPTVSTATAYPDPQGPGSNVTLSATATDDDTILNVVATITTPNGSVFVATMVPVGDDVYQTNFSNTWKNGTYYYSVKATDSTGSSSILSGQYFTIAFDAFLNISVEYLSYSQNDDVRLITHPNGWWIGQDWLHKRNVTLTSQDSPLFNVTVAFDIDTASLIADGKLQSDCEDLRFSLDNTSIDFAIEDCNTVNTTITTVMNLFDGSVSFDYFYGNPSATAVNQSVDSFRTYHAYVVSNELATSQLDVASYQNGTTVCLYNGTGVDCVSLDQSEVTSWAANVITNTTYITADGYIGTGFRYAGAGDSMVPVGLAGTEFVYPAPRGSQSLDFFALFADANVKAYDSSGQLRGEVDIPIGTMGEINYGFTANTGFTVIANTSVLAHYEAPTGNDFQPMRPATNDLYGILSTGTYYDVACLNNDTEFTVYFDNGTADYHTCDAGGTVEIGTGNSQGQGPSVHIIANNSIGALSTADGDGTESVIFLAPEDLGMEYVFPQDAEYISVVPITPDTQCTLYDSLGSPLSGSTSTSYAPPRPQDTIYFSGSPIVAGARLVCNNSVFAYYEYSTENGETNIFGKDSFALRPHALSVVSGAEMNYSSVLSNTGQSTLSGFLVFSIQRNLSGGWQDYATIRDDYASNDLTVLQARTALDLGTEWNLTPWNVGSAPAGDYRAKVSVLDIFGEVLVESSSPYQPLQNYSIFNITPPNVLLNISAITLYDVSDSLNKHIYSAELIDNGTNKTFVIESEDEYRIDVRVDVLSGSDPWVINTTAVSYNDLNSSWIVNADDDIWYLNDTDSTERLGGIWNGSVLWNTSLNGEAGPGSSVVFSFILNLTGMKSETLQTQFFLNDPLFQIEDLSIFKILEPDMRPPEIVSPLLSFYNLTVYEVIRGQSTKAHGRWDEEIKNATITYNSTAFSTQKYFVTLLPSNPMNWSNYTITTSSAWPRGHHVAKLEAADLLDNWNTSLGFLDFSVWGLSQVSSGSVSDAIPTLLDTVNVSCRVLDPTAGSVPVNGLLVTFMNGSQTIGYALTNSTGWATFSYIDETPGTETMRCEVTDNRTLFYKADAQYYYETDITTTEPVAPTWSEQTATSRAYRGDTVSLSVRWQDNFQLESATLATNATGSFVNQSSFAMTGNDDFANISYVIPYSMDPGILGWYQTGNDTSGNSNVTAVSTLEIWAWAELASMSLQPSSLVLGNTTNITCRVLDANTSTPIQGYVIEFRNQTEIIGYNVTNDTGYAHFRYTDSTLGLENIHCQIYENTTRQINVSDAEQIRVLNTVAGGDIWQPVIINNEYGINATSARKGSHFKLFARWNESINSSLAWYNVSSPSLVYQNVSPPFTYFWTNFTLVTNSSWTVGPHVTRLTARDQSGNENTTAELLHFNLTATVNTTWKGPSGDQDPGSLNLTCLVQEEQGGAPVANYVVYFYDDVGGLIGTPSTNASGIAVQAYDASSLSGEYDFSCRIFAAPPKFYYLGNPFTAITTMYFDTEAPHIALEYPGDDNQVANFDILFNFTATDDHDTSMTCNLTIDGVDEQQGFAASNGSTTSILQTVTPGLHDWNVTCIDDAGNSNTSLTYTFNMSQPDIEPPVIELLAPVDDAYLNETTVVFSYNVSDAGVVQNCSLYLDGVLNVSDDDVQADFDTLTVPGVGEGAHSWYLTCTDAGLNTNTSEYREFTIDTTPPAAFNLLSPSNGTITQSLSSELSWEQASDSNFDNYTLELSSDESFSAILARYYSYSEIITALNATFEPDRTYHWRVIAYDRAANSRVAGWFTYTTDTTGPSVSLIAPGPGAFTENTSILFRYHAIDNAFASCSLYTNSTGSWSDNMTNSSIPSSGTHQFVASFEQNITILWNVLCIDSLGNSAFAAQNRTLFIGPARDHYDNETIPVNLTVNNSAPDVEVISSDPTVYLVAGGITQVTCEANVSDRNSAGDIVLVNATLNSGASTWSSPDTNASHYTNASCSCSDINISTQACTCAFGLLYYADPGVWLCRVVATDDAGATDFGVDISNVQSLRALVVEEQMIDYDNHTTGEISEEKNVTIQNLGNVQMDLSLLGYGSTGDDDLAMTCDAGEVPVSYERFSDASGTPYASMIPLSGNSAARSQVDLNLPRQTDATNSTDLLHWRLEISPGAAGICSGTVVFQAEVDT